MNTLKTPVAFSASHKKRLVRFNPDDHQESAKLAKFIFHKLVTGSCGDKDKKTPGAIAIACWGISNMNILRSGLHFMVSGAKFKGYVDIRKGQDEKYSIEFSQASEGLDAPVKLHTISDLSDYDLVESIDLAVERVGLTNALKSGDRGIQSKSFLVDALTNQALEWNESTQEQREAVVYDIFIRNPKANISHMESVPSIARREWQDLTATERNMLNEFNIEDALAEYKSRSEEPQKIV